MPDLNTLSLDQRHALRTAAATLHQEFDSIFSTETIELFLETSYDQFADRAKFTNFLPLMAERFARQRLRALAKVEGHRRRRHADRAVPVRAQRRTVADGARLVQPPRRRPSHRLVRRLRTRHRDQPGRRRRDGRGRHRHHRRVPQALDRRRSSRPPTSSSPWAAATPARCTPASATRTGSSTIRPASTSPPFGPSATRSAARVEGAPRLPPAGPGRLTSLDRDATQPAPSTTLRCNVSHNRSRWRRRAGSS